MTKKIEKEETKTVDTEFPAWRYGPGGEGRIFERGEPVPEGWVDHPSDALPPIDL